MSHNAKPLVIEGTSVRVGRDIPKPGSADERFQLYSDRLSLEAGADAAADRLAQAQAKRTVNLLTAAFFGVVAIAGGGYYYHRNGDARCGGDSRTGSLVETRAGDIRQVSGGHYTTDFARGVCVIRSKGDEGVELTLDRTMADRYRQQRAATPQTP